MKYLCHLSGHIAVIPKPEFRIFLGKSLLLVAPFGVTRTSRSKSMREAFSSRRWAALFAGSMARLRSHFQGRWIRVFGAMINQGPWEWKISGETKGDQPRETKGDMLGVSSTKGNQPFPRETNQGKPSNQGKFRGKPSPTIDPFQVVLRYTPELETRSEFTVPLKIKGWKIKFLLGRFGLFSGANCWF